jgi:hypothetical protein
MTYRKMKPKRIRAANSLPFLLLTLISLCLSASSGGRHAAAWADQSDRAKSAPSLKHTAPAAPFKIEQTTAFAPVQKIFDSKHMPGNQNWIGGDSAYSLALPNGTNLWLFGDSLIGKIEGGKRIDCHMVHNAVAIEKPGSATRFYWGHESTAQIKRRTAGAGFFGRSTFAECYYWPGDCFYSNNKLYIFLHAVKTNRDRKAPFQFELVTDELLEVQNPLEEPNTWKMVRHPLFNRAGWMVYGVAVQQDRNYIYVFCSDCGYALGGNNNPTILARLPKKALTSVQPGSFEFWTDTEESTHWVKDYHQARVLIEDGASEMSVTAIPGLKGLFAFYIPGPMQAVLMRHAPKPEGPWSAAVTVCPLPKTPADRFYYSCKAHPQYSNQKDTVVLTYCSNTRLLSRLITDSQVYFPTALKVKLSTVKR